MMSLAKSLLILCLTLSTSKTVESIKCYQCSGTDSDNPFECNEYFNNDIDIFPKDCDSIHDAQYCIKHVGRYEGMSINCYQCNSSSSMECGDGLLNLDGGVLKPTPCEHVYNAQFCIKHTGAQLMMRGGLDDSSYADPVWIGDFTQTHTPANCFSGGISTKRSCSSLDLGNYCNYVQQPGDKLEYRTCIYTCSTDGCNAASGLATSTVVPFLIGFHIFRYMPI